jgi:hypothetical protein
LAFDDLVFDDLVFNDLVFDNLAFDDLTRRQNLALKIGICKLGQLRCRLFDS